jgi:puromycin-sensitive aminopeptidase
VTDMAEYRLPGSARPRRYQLELTPDLTESSFDGVEIVTLDVHEPIRELVCNAVELQIHEARLESPGGSDLAGRVDLDAGTQRATITFDEELAPGSNYRLHLRFTGILNDQLHGFYRSTFTADDGTEHVIAVTQFEPADARRAFPCWDEPEFKASFSVSVGGPVQRRGTQRGARRGGPAAGPFSRDHGHVDLSGGVRGGTVRTSPGRGH